MFTTKRVPRRVGVCSCGSGRQSVGSSCGGVDGIPWLIAGVVLTAIAVILYVLAFRHSSRNGRAVAPMAG